MKIDTTAFYRALKPSFMATVFVFLAGLFVLSCKNHQTRPLFTTFSMPEHELITSLDSLNQDTLLVGTDQGNLYYYCPKTDDSPVDTLRVGNHRPVYVAYPSDLGLFVGVSNEGLKLFSSYGKSDRKPKHQYLLQLNGDTCTTEYAVYKMLRFGDTLFCATSNGLAWLKLSNLKDTILKSLYPNIYLPDCKIEHLYLEGDSLKVYYNDSILSFNIRGRFNKQHTSRPIPSDSREEMVSINNITYKFKQYDTKFYAYDTLTINPHNFVFVTSMNNDKVIAIADDDGITKDVYVGKKGGKLRWNKTWTKCLRNVPGQITDFIVFPNESCLILTSEEVAYKGDKRGVQRLEFPSGAATPQKETTPKKNVYEDDKYGVVQRLEYKSKPKDQPNRVKSVYYSPNFEKLYMAFGAGYAYYNLNLGNPIWDSCCFVDYKDSANKSHAFRCFAEWDKKLCCGTIDDGFLYLDEKNNLIGTLPYQDIRYFKYATHQYGSQHRDKFYVLTGDSVYVISDTTISLGNSFVRRLYFAKESGSVFGVSDGHVYLYNHIDRKLTCYHLDPTYGLVNPYAILDLQYEKDCYCLYIGTNHGLFYSQNGDLNHMTPVDIRDFWRTFNPVPFVLASVIVLILFLGYLLFRFMKQRHINTANELKNTTEEKTILESQIKTMEEDKRSLVSRTKTMEEDKRGLEGQLKNMEEDKRGLEGRIKTMEEDRRGLEGRIKTMEEERRGLEGRIKTMEEDRRGLEGQLKNMEEDRRGLESQLKNMEEDRRGLEGRIKTMEEDKKTLEGQLKTIEDVKTGVENKLREVILNRYQKLYSNNLPDKDNEKSEDWVIQASSQYKDKYRNLEVEVEKSTFTKDNSIEKMRESVNRSMLEYAFAAGVYLLRDELKRRDLYDKEVIKDVYLKIKNLSDNYLEEIVLYTADNNNKKDVYLHLWIIALLSEGEKTDRHNYINNDEFLRDYIQQTEYVRLMTLQNDEYEKPTGLKFDIRIDICKNHNFFQPKSKDATISELFNKIVKTIKDKHRIGEYTGGYKNAQKKKNELETMKENLEAYVSKIPGENEDWKEIIDKIVLLRGKKQKNGFVFDGTFHDDNLPNKRLLKEGVRLDIKNCQLTVSEFENPLKELFNKIICNDIRGNILNLRIFPENELFYKRMKDFYASIKLLFESKSVEKMDDLDGALLLWTWGLVVNKQRCNKDFLQEFIQKMQNKSNENGNKEIIELERWVTTLASYDKPSSIIKPKKQFAILLKEEDWENARLSVLNMFGINRQR